MTTYDPDSLDQDPNVLLRIVDELGGKLGLDCAVVAGGILEDDIARSQPSARPVALFQ